MARCPPSNINIIRRSSKRRHEDNNYEATSILRWRKTGLSVFLDTKSEEQDILSSIVPKKESKFKIPNLEKYDMTQEHIANYHAVMLLQILKRLCASLSMKNWSNWLTTGLITSSTSYDTGSYNNSRQVETHKRILHLSK